MYINLLSFSDLVRTAIHNYVRKSLIIIQLKLEHAKNEKYILNDMLFKWKN